MINNQNDPGNGCTEIRNSGKAAMFQMDLGENENESGKRIVQGLF